MEIMDDVANKIYDNHESTQRIIYRPKDRPRTMMTAIDNDYLDRESIGRTDDDFGVVMAAEMFDDLSSRHS